jgi:hypothetical protein
MLSVIILSVVAPVSDEGKRFYESDTRPSRFAFKTPAWKLLRLLSTILISGTKAPGVTYKWAQYAIVFLLAELYRLV